MWEFKRIGSKNKAALSEYLQRAEAGPSFFNSPYSLDIFLNHGIKKLYLAVPGSDTRLILLREKSFGNDVRILFSVFRDDGLIAAIKDRFDPVYIACNMANAGDFSYLARSDRNELMVDLPTVANLSDPGIRHGFNDFNKRHPDIKFEKIDSCHKEALLEFFDKWDQIQDTRLKVRGMENDMYYLDNYLGDPDIDGEVAIDKDKIIGYTVFAPACPAGTAVGLFGKCLRGYRELGIRLNVARARRALAKGYKRLAIGGVNSGGQGSFKMRLAMNGEIIKLGNYEIFISQKIKLHGDYLGSVL